MSVTTAGRSARRTARRVGGSNALEVITRIGFVGYGLLHLAIAWLAVEIAMGRQTGKADQSGAFRLLLKQPLGRVLLIVIAVGLTGMAIWQLLLAAVGHRSLHGRSRTMQRIASAGRTLIYSALAWTAFAVWFGSSTSSSTTQQHATAGVLGDPAGRWLVGLAGLIVLGIGLGMIVYGVKRGFERNLKLTGLSAPVRRGTKTLAIIGYVARGIAFAIVGLLLCDAALADSASRSQGLDGAIRTLAAQPFGGLLLGIVAAGFAAFGVYCFFQARYRKV
jgi:hypothetical protein